MRHSTTELYNYFPSTQIHNPYPNTCAIYLQAIGVAASTPGTQETDRKTKQITTHNFTTESWKRRSLLQGIVLCNQTRV